MTPAPTDQRRVAERADAAASLLYVHGFITRPERAKIALRIERATLQERRE